MMEIDTREGDLATFARAFIECGDIDPAYPILRWCMDAYGMDTEQRFWLLTLHLGYYHIGSALTAWEYTNGSMQNLPRDLLETLPRNTERRGLRQRGMIEGYLRGYRETIYLHGGSQEAYWTERISTEPEKAFDDVWTRANAIPYNGRWAAFKMIDLMMHTVDTPIRMPDMRLSDCSGPKEGLAWLYGEDEDDLTALDERSHDLNDRLQRHGLHLPWDQIETTLCDFNSMRKGNYYVGHDIDSQLEDIRIASDTARCEILYGRKHTFPLAYLGEHHDWDGIDRERNKAYARSGQVATRA